MRQLVSGKRLGSLLLLAALACGPERELTSPASTIDHLSTSLVREGESLLGPDGKFSLRALGPDDQPDIGASDAALFAELAARQYGPMIASDLEDQYGGPIDFSTLRACDRTLFARSPFEELPTGLSRSAAHYLGSFWITAVCGVGGQRQVSVAIAAGASEITVSQGLLVVPPNAVKMVGIPPSWDAPVPVSPEAAAVLAAQETGALVAAVPVLVAPNPVQAFPQGANWVIALDRAVSVHGERSNHTRQTAEVLVASAEVPANSMRRGPVGLYHALPGGRRVLPFLDFNTARTPVSIGVEFWATLDLEKVNPLGGGR